MPHRPPPSAAGEPHVNGVAGAFKWPVPPTPGAPGPWEGPEFQAQVPPRRRGGAAPRPPAVLGPVHGRDLASDAGRPLMTSCPGQWAGQGPCAEAHGSPPSPTH